MNFSRDYIKHKTGANQQGKMSEVNISWSMENQKGKKKNEHKRHKGYGESSNHKRGE